MENPSHLSPPPADPSQNKINHWNSHVRWCFIVPCDQISALRSIMSHPLLVGGEVDTDVNGGEPSFSLSLFFLKSIFCLSLDLYGMEIGIARVAAASGYLH